MKVTENLSDILVTVNVTCMLHYLYDLITNQLTN